MTALVDDILVFLCVAAAVTYLALSARRFVKRVGQGTGCGCDGAAPKKRRGTMVHLEPPRRRQSRSDPVAGELSSKDKTGR